MRRALLLLPRLQQCSPAVARTFSSKASVTLQTPDAEVDATEDHSRESMVSSDLDKHLRKFDEIALSEHFRFVPTSSVRLPTLLLLWRST
jgi:hypothetical protein